VLHFSSHTIYIMATTWLHFCFS